MTEQNETPKVNAKPGKTESPEFQTEEYEQNETREVLEGNDPKLEGMPGYQAPHVVKETVRVRKKRRVPR